MSKKSIKKNYIYNLSYQILLVLTPLVTTPYLSRVLGSYGVGQVSYIESIVSYFVLFATLGVTALGQREISYFQDDIDKRTEVFFNIFILKLIISAIVIIIYIFFDIYFFKSNLYTVFIIYLLSVTIDVTWFFQGLEEFRIVTIRNSFFRILNIILIFIFVNRKTDLFNYCFILSVCTFLCNASLLPYLKRYINGINISKLMPFSYLSASILLFLPNVAIQIYTVLDKIMIGLITRDPNENGFYEQSIKISKFLLFIVTALGTVVVPRIGYYFTKNDQTNLKNLIYKSYRLTLLIAIPITFGLYFISDNFIPWFLGEDFNKSIVLMKILSVLVILIGLSNVTGIQYMVPTKREKMLTLSLTIGAVINFCLNLYLIRHYKSIGAAIASIIAESTITFLQLFFVRLEISFIKILKDSYKYILSAILMFIVDMLFLRNLIPSIANTMKIIMISAVIYFIFIILFQDDFFIEMIKRTRKYLARNDK